MHVLLISTDNPRITRLGGKHVHLLLLEKGLRSLGAIVDTLYYDSRDPIELTKRILFQTLPIDQRYNNKIKSMIGYLRKHVPETDFNVGHAHDVLSLLSIRESPKKKVLTLHGYFARENIEFIKTRSDRPAIYSRLVNLESEAMQIADWIITVDERLRNYARSEFDYPPERITAIQNAIDTDTFQPVNTEEQRRLKNDLGFSNEDFVILVPRRLVEKNGVIFAVRAMRKIISNNIRMLIVGDGPERRDVFQEKTGDERIRMIGAVPHELIDRYFKMSDAIMVPSITSHGVQEATSLSMLEGMSCGKVVICSDIGGMHEVVRNMRNGILVREQDPDDLADAISRIVEHLDLRERMGKEAREYAVKQHSYVSHARRVMDIYTSVLNEK